MVVWGSEFGIGNTHSFKATPFVVAGGCAGAIPTGRYLEFDESVDHNRLLVSMCHAMGLSDVQTFGDTPTRAAARSRDCCADAHSSCSSMDRQPCISRPVARSTLK